MYPENYYIVLHGAIPGKTTADVEADVMTVLMQRAVDLVEVRTRRQVKDIRINYSKKILKSGPRVLLFLKGTQFDTRREEAILKVVARLQNSVRVDDYEILARLQPNLNVPSGCDEVYQGV